jgi:hypothetical protein
MPQRENLGKRQVTAVSYAIRAQNLQLSSGQDLSTEDLRFSAELAIMHVTVR